jgi:hypothetical protein
MRNRWWRWVAGMFAALMLALVVLPQTGDAAQTGQNSAMNGQGRGNSKMRKMMMIRMMKKRRMMQGQQGVKSGTGTANAAGS